MSKLEQSAVDVQIKKLMKLTIPELFKKYLSEISSRVNNGEIEEYLL